MQDVSHLQMNTAWEGDQNLLLGKARPHSEVCPEQNSVLCTVPDCRLQVVGLGLKASGEGRGLNSRPHVSNYHTALEQTGSGRLVGQETAYLENSPRIRWEKMEDCRIARMFSKILQSFFGPTLFPQLLTWVYQGLTFNHRCTHKDGSVLRRVYIEKIPFGCLYLKT